MIRRPFEQWLSEDVEITFNIERVSDLPLLTQWLDVPKNNPLSPKIDKLRIFLSNNVEYWNEDELKMMFLAAFLGEFEFNNAPFYRVFIQRKSSTQMFDIETNEVNERVEWFIATGKQTPKKPFFFLQEYKQEKNSGNDPLGQLLIAMVEAQILNEDAKKPLFGCYMIGRFWFFIVLEDKKYSVSRAYDSTQIDELSEIVVVLERVKEHIHKELGLPAPVKNNYN